MPLSRIIPLSLVIVGVAIPSLAHAAAEFAPYQAIATGSWPEAVAIGDVTGDGRNDVVMTTSYYFDPAKDYKVMVFVQTQAGTLAPPVIYDTAGGYTNSPKTVAIGDMNHDGRNDVVIGNTGSSIQVFYQNVNGTLTASTPLPTPYSNKIRVGDLNHDNLLDVAGIGWAGNEVGVFLQDSGGTLSLSGAYTAPHGGYDDLELGDIDSNGLTDIIVMSGQSTSYNNVAVLRQKNNGTFAAPVYLDLGGNELTQGVGVGDVTGDGRNDVVVSYGGNRPTSYIAYFAQPKTLPVPAPVSLASYDIPESLDVADVSNDGRSDVVVLHGGWNSLGVYEQQANGSLAAESLFPIPYASHYNPHGLAVGDINSDGKNDVVIADYNSGLVVLRNIANAIPVANAGSDVAVTQGDTVILDGTASTDSDGTIVTFKWAQLSGPTVTLSSTATAGVVTFNAPSVTGLTSLVFRLKVVDNQGAVSFDKISIDVSP